VIALDNAVKIALDFARSHPRETLIIVTGDHETGGMTIGFAGTQYNTFFDKVALQKKSFIAFNDEVLISYKKNTPKERAKLADLLPAISESFGLDYRALSDFQKQQLEFAFQRSMGGEIERPVAEDQYLLYGGLRAADRQDNPAYEPDSGHRLDILRPHRRSGYHLCLRRSPGTVQRLLRQHGYIQEAGFGDEP
jgi:hypothetical protein